MDTGPEPFEGPGAPRGFGSILLLTPREGLLGPSAVISAQILLFDPWE